MRSTKRKSLSIAEKAVILQRLQNGEMNTMLAKEYGVPHSTISSIKKNKHRIESLLHTNDPKRKRVRTSTHKQVEQALLHWTKQQSDQGIPVNGPILLEKANMFGVHLNIPDFKCSLSWINRFKVRYNVVNGKIACESPVQSAISEWLANAWPGLRSRFTDDKIYNANETELFYESEEKTLQFKIDKCAGQHSKSKLTVMIATNMSGTVKKNLLVIGKPRCIKNLRVPVDYENNRKAWMTADIFTKWLRAWDDYLTEKKDKILLLVDNSPVHVPISDLKSVTLVFLPPSTTSALKPHKGIIQALESAFQKNLALRTAEYRETNDDSASSPNITLLDAVLMTYEAWNALTTTTIKNCFKQAGLIQSNAGCSSNSNMEDKGMSAFAFDHIKVEFDEDDAVTSEESCDDNMAPQIEIKQEILDNNDGHDNEADDQDDYKKLFSTPSASEALIAAEMLSVFVNSNFDDDNLKSMMSRIHDAVRDTYCQIKDNQT